MNAHITDTKNNNAVAEYIIDDGTKVIPIKNKYGDILAEVKFKTTDVNIMERAEKAQGNITEILKELKNISINPDGTADSNDNMNILTDAKAKLTEQINSIFGDDVCTQLFDKCSPFSPVGGRFFVDIVAEVLTKIIDDEMTRQQEEIIGEYTSDVQ